MYTHTCRDYDQCYHCGGYHGLDRKECDDQMKTDMTKICEGFNWDKKPLCYAAAWQFHWLISEYGDNYYHNNGQNAAWCANDTCVTDILNETAADAETNAFDFMSFHDQGNCNASRESLVDTVTGIINDTRTTVGTSDAIDFVFAYVTSVIDCSNKTMNTTVAVSVFESLLFVALRDTPCITSIMRDISPSYISFSKDLRLICRPCMNETLTQNNVWETTCTSEETTI